MNMHVTVKKKIAQYKDKTTTLQTFLWMSTINSFLNIFIFTQWIQVTKCIHDSNTNTISKCIIHGKNMQKPAQTRTNAKFHVATTGYKWGINEIAVEGRKEIQVHSTSNTRVRNKNKIKTNIIYMFLVLPSCTWLNCVTDAREEMSEPGTVLKVISV